ncbi:MAG TPA: tryptophan 7-halogenase [Acidimicrobiales bacterium]|nr:tryptophan 7-halogenase [Acidimicrobiales bacterium]
MAEIVVFGGSIIGSSAAMLLAREGHRVTVLESDPTHPPADPVAAWDSWGRKGVPQFDQPHNLFPRARQIMDDDLPGLTEAILAAGGARMNPMANLPPTLADRSPFPGDERFEYVNARRPVLEAVIAHAAAATEGVSIRRGARVSGLTVDAAGAIPRVTGVHLDDGSQVSANLVVDASGRRSKLAEWLGALGDVKPHVESEDSGFVYFTRYFRGPERPQFLGPGLAPLGSISLLTLVGDNDTWSVTVFAASSDKDLRGLKDVARFAKVVGACPLQAHWLDGEPISHIKVMAGVLDRYRRYIVDGAPIATGVVPVGDAWACTNPSAGRGMTIGLIHAQRLRDAARQGVDDDLPLRFDELTERDVTPFYRNQIASDRIRVAQMDAHRSGDDPPPGDAAMNAVLAAMPFDPFVFRAAVETLTCLALPQEIFARPEVVKGIEAYAGQTPTPAPGPTRPELLALLG